MIGEKIKELRTDRNMTQRELASRLFVTAQAVSRWENGEVEPSVGTVAKIADIFHVSADVLLGTESAATGAPENEKAAEVEEEKKEDSAAKEPEVRTEYVYRDAPRVPLALCSRCTKPIYESEDIRRTYGLDDRERIICRACDEKAKAREQAEESADAAHQRKLSYILGALAAAILIGIGIGLLASGQPTLYGIITMVCALPAFTLVSCLLIENNFIRDMMAWIMHFTLHLPGLIFELDLDGIIWLLTVKLLFWILGFIFSAMLAALAVAVGGALSIFVYPYAIVHSIRHPEDCD